MALNAALIVFALASFRLPRGKALGVAILALSLLLPAVVATPAFPAFGSAHRAAIVAAFPPFAALIATLAPFLRPPRTNALADMSSAAAAVRNVAGVPDAIGAAARLPPPRVAAVDRAAVHAMAAAHARWLVDDDDDEGDARSEYTESDF